ncbi:MAG: alanine/glycine:cation symporter family protein [Sandaracinaceae bacterium]
MRRLPASFVALLLLVFLGAAPLSALAQTGDESPRIGAPAPAPIVPRGWADAVDDAFGAILVDPIAAVLYFDLIFWDGRGNERDLQLPFIVFWLVLGATFFTLRMAFINVRGFRHAIEITLGKYDDPEEEGEVSHFQALSSALSATVGLGNIAGVAIAVSVGGPGAVFWMVAAGFLGMTSKFTECTLGQMYRRVDERGRVLGGPMRYLKVGLDDLQEDLKGSLTEARLRRLFPFIPASVGPLGALGRGLAVLFSVMCIGGSFGGGNMFQANQAFAQASRVIPWLEGKALLFGIVLAALVGIVIIGGIRRIGRVAETIVPFMCGIYVLAGLVILVGNAPAVPAAFGTIVGSAFTLEAGFGGVLGTLITGFKRAAFSNEAGVGSASIAHSAASTSEPVREGLVALLEPFIDTLVVCTMTGLVVVVTGEYLNPSYAEGDSNIAGVSMTSAAFESVLPWFPYVLALAVFLFAFSTMVSWSYYGERAWSFLFGTGTSLVYKSMFLVFVVLGSILKLANVTDFGDLMILGMALPNIAGLFLLSGKVKGALDDYWARYSSGAMDDALAAAESTSEPAGE